MSLIQVSSFQERLQNVSQGKQTFQRGSSFSNYFNNLLNIPKDSEIALHSAQFRVQNRGSFDFNGLSQEGGYYNVRMLYGSDRDDYSGAGRPPYATHFPLLSYIPQKKYAEVEDLGDDIAKLLSLSSIPALQGAFTSELTIDATNKKKITFNVALNAGNKNLEKLDAGLIVKGDNLLYDSIEGRVTKNVTSGSAPRQGQEFTSQMNGIHNIGEIVFDKLNAPASAFAAGVPYPRKSTNHIMALGVKRYVNEKFHQDQMYQYSPARINPAIQFRELSGIFGLPETCIGEYMFVVRGKSNGGNQVKGQPCIDIVKYELDEGGYSNPVVIATGDTIINDLYNIPYSTMLDASTTEWTDAGGTENQIIAPIGTDSPVLKIVFAGNKVTFVINDEVVETGETPEAAMEVLEVPLGDEVFPLQPLGCLTGAGDSMDFEFTPIKLNSQKELNYFGDNYDDAIKYFSVNSLIPSELFNQNSNRTSPTRYFIDSGTGGGSVVVNPTTVPFDTLAGNFLDTGGTSSGALVLGIGNNPSTNMIQEVGESGVLNPNIQGVVGANLSAIAFTQAAAGVGFLEGSFVSDSADTITPFLKGIYIRLRNLPNRSTFGSLNSADTDKLISVINKYDYTERQSGEQYPIYNYNENEKLYVALNNPAEIQVNKLDFQLVDKSGKEVTDVDETTLVLHLRPRRV